jgi:hypothetical protein
MNLWVRSGAPSSCAPLRPKAPNFVSGLLRSCPEIAATTFLVMAGMSMLQAAFMNCVVDKDAMVRGYLREMTSP